ncbi:MAG: hypothetical protein AB8B53_02205 [Flavobacteriales bacterium]
MTKQKFLIGYGVFSLAMFLFAVVTYFGVAKNLWWFACMLSGAISSTYCYYGIRKKISEESFVNFIMNIFIVTSFLISYGLAVYQGGDENLPIILCAVNAVIWLFYSVWLSKKL